MPVAIKSGDPGFNCFSWVMDTEPTRPPTVLIPFPSCSVNLLAGPSSVGKSHFLKHLLTHLPVYFQQAVNTIWVVHCNDIVPVYQFSEPLRHSKFEQLSLTDFDLDVIEEHDLIIFEDVQEVTPKIRRVINVYAHHSHLASVFLVTHAILGNSDLYSLINNSHRVLFFLRAAGISKQAFYVSSRFFRDQETRAYLDTLFGFVERQKGVLLLEVNPLANQPVQHLALSHLDQLPRGYCLIYPHLGTLTQFRKAHPGGRVTRAMAEAFAFEEDTTFPAHTYVAVPADMLLAQKGSMAALDEEEEGEGGCANERAQWNEIVTRMEENIEHYLKASKWFAAKNLLREILSRPEFCITQDGRYFHLKQSPRGKISLLDYLLLATRRAGPMEKVLSPEWKSSAQMTKFLLDRGAPRSLFTNKLLLPESGTSLS